MVFLYMIEISNGALRSATISAIWTSKIKGIPYTKERLLVLWRKVYIPKMEPMLPPITAMIKKGCFRNPEGPFFCFVFVNAHEGKADEIY